MRSDKWSAVIGVALVPTLVLALAGCGASDLLPHYTGPQPSREPIASERVVVREIVLSAIHTDAAGAVYGERTRYLEAGDPHNVNRVIRAAGGELHTELAALNVKVGDTLLISTRYDTTYYDAVAPGAVPDWPGHTHLEYPIARHTLTSVERVP
jgi:hypothetical protein